MPKAGQSRDLDVTEDVYSSHDHNVSNSAVKLWNEICALGLQENVAELEVLGYTIIKPDKVGPPGFVERVRQAVLQVAERRNGVAPNVDDAGTVFPSSALDERPGYGNGFGQRLTYLLFEDPVFQEVLMHPVALALASYLVGEKCMLYSMMAFLKGPGGNDLQIHCDNAKFASPFPPVPQICNVTWVLSDYSLENGSIAFVPGSHRHMRHPMVGEGVEDRVPLDAPAGSLIFWGGATWHGAFGRKVPGLRQTLISVYCRPTLLPQEPYRTDVTQELLNSSPSRFNTLIGTENNYGWRAEGPQREETSYQFGRSWYD